MSNFQRYAVYYLPEDPELASFGATWLGWDIARGLPVPQPEVPGIEMATNSPRKYGFHATLKPPFRLAQGANQHELSSAVASLAKRVGPVQSDGALELTTIGSFLALEPGDGMEALRSLAFLCVSKLDSFRHPPDAAELHRRRTSGLTSEQDALLMKWGYPYVAKAFRFHMTLTGPIAPEVRSLVSDALHDLLPPLPNPFVIRQIALVGEGPDGMFRLIRKFPLSGSETTVFAS